MGESDSEQPLTRDSREHHNNTGEARSLEAGFEVKYLSMDRCKDGILQQHNTAAFTAIMPGSEG